MIAEQMEVELMKSKRWDSCIYVLSYGYGFWCTSTRDSLDKICTWWPTQTKFVDIEHLDKANANSILSAIKSAYRRLTSSDFKPKSENKLESHLEQELICYCDERF